MRKMIDENIAHHQKIQKEYYDKKTTEKKYKIGDLVALAQHQQYKLSPCYAGPYLVVKVDDMPPNTILIADPDDPDHGFLTSMKRTKYWRIRSD